MKTQINQINQTDIMIHKAAKALYSQFAEQYGTGRFRKRGEYDYRFTVDYVGAISFNKRGVFINQGDGLTCLVCLNDGKINFINASGLVPLTAAVVTVLNDHGFVCKSGDVANMLTVLNLKSKASLIDMMRLAADLAEYAGLEGDAVRYMGLDGISIDENSSIPYRVFMNTDGNDLTFKVFYAGHTSDNIYGDWVNEDREWLIDSLDYTVEKVVEDVRENVEIDQLIDQLIAFTKTL